MFTILNEKERKDFINKYFKVWEKDIWKVSRISYNNIDEYLINEHYLFLVKG